MATMVSQELSRRRQHSGGVTIVSIVDVNECHSNPCANGATCVDGVHQYSCSCAAGYTGSDCKTGITIDCITTFIISTHLYIMWAYSTCLGIDVFALVSPS